MRPQDIIILLKLISSEGRGMSNKDMAQELQISASEFCESLERCREAKLIDNSKRFVNTLALEEFLVHGIKYVFPITPQAKVRGIPTFITAPFLKDKIAQGSDCYVWKSSKGKIREEEVKPLYKTVPEAVLRDPKLYELLVLTDMFRMERVREVEIAKEELSKKLAEYNA
ncbi:MAG: hypothetical protein J1F67_10685 [Muribaculaceae bacterium]|nr:hypothetical protein [Muribaculaceae bacterium]